MAIKTDKGFMPHGSRSKFDYELCTASDGWATLDTSDDAPYLGNWVNPFKRQLQSYVEGDTYLTTCDTDEEFATEVVTTVGFYEKQGSFLGIDPQGNSELENKLRELCLGDYLL